MRSRHNGFTPVLEGLRTLKLFSSNKKNLSPSSENQIGNGPAAKLSELNLPDYEEEIFTNPNLAVDSESNNNCIINYRILKT